MNFFLSFRNFSPPTEKLNYSQTIEFIDYEESLRRLSRLVDLFHDALITNLGYLAENHDILKTAVVAFEAQFKIEGRLNDELISSPMAWDVTTSLPSYPTLVADLQSFLKIFKPDDPFLATFLRSFAGWTLLTQEKTLRCCGSNLHMKEVGMNIKLNHVLKVTNGWLNFRQLVGVESPDVSHKALEEYFDFGRPSQAVDGLVIILDREWMLRVTNGRPEIRKVKTQKAALFNLAKFQDMITWLI